jgi:putative ABC transport system permease protein
MKKNIAPPRIFQRFFCWFCRPQLRDSIEGDLLELYHERVQTKGKRKADLLFMIDVLLLLRPGIIRSVNQPKLTHQNQYSMLKNNLKIGWRNIIKDRAHSLLNIISLCTGLTCFIFIALWVSDELSYDKFNTNYDRIVRLTSNIKTETGTRSTAMTSAPMAKALAQDYSEVENAVRIKMREEIITHNGQQVLQPGILMTDPSFFDIFSYRLDRGDAASALKEPYSIVLTQSAAKKYFGDSDPMGQTLLLNMYDSSGTGALYKITGVMPDPVQNAHFTFNMLSSFKTIEVAHPEILTMDGWGDGSYYTYLLLKKNVDAAVFSKKIPWFYEKYVGELFSIWKPIYTYQLQPLSDIYLRSTVHDEIAPTGSITKVYVFSLIGIFILLLAGINYTNLATARAAGRAKEVSIKKVIGAGKGQLISQFLLESATITFIACFFHWRWLCFAPCFLPAYRKKYFTVFFAAAPVVPGS